LEAQGSKKIEKKERKRRNSITSTTTTTTTMATLFDHIKVKLPKKCFKKCFECKEEGHMGYECKKRKEQYNKLGIEIKGRMEALRCEECKTRSNLITSCKHVICEGCDNKINYLGVCNKCSHIQTRLAVFERICPS
jgi:hypothetical protein